MAHNAPLELFSSLTSKEALLRLRSEQVPEDLYLEYKEKTDRRTPVLDAPDKKNCAKALSGFANSAGGVIVWGVEEMRGKNIIKSLKPVADAKQFAINLENLTRSLVMPVPDGILIKPISADGANLKSGFVKCLVPESSLGPHRSLPDHEYYKRNSSEFYKLEHFDLEDMFGRRQKPHLQVFAKGEKLETDHGLVKIKLWAKNEGKAIARHISIMVIFEEGASSIESVGGEITSLTTENDGKPIAQYSQEVGTFHPRGPRYTLGEVTIRQKDRGEWPRCTVAVACSGMPTIHVPLEVVR